MEKRKILNNKWNCLLVLIILYCSESLMLRELLSASVRAGIIIAFSAVYIMFNGEKAHIQIRKNMLMTLIVLLFCIMLSVTINGFDFSFDLWVILMLFAAIVICSSINYCDFWIAFVDVMAVLGFISAVIFILYQLVPGVFSMFPNYVWHGNILMKNCFICALQVNTQFRRNFGIFYEPGMFSVFLVLALYFSLFRLKLDIKKTGALLLALATTLSTNGYICAVGLIIAFLLSRQSISKKMKKRITFLIAVGVIAVGVFLVNNADALWFLTNKLSEFNIKTSVNMNDSGSGYERWRSIVYAWRAFLSNPIVGVGYVGWIRIFQSIIATATPINWFGIYGIVYGCIMNFLYLRNARVYTQRGNVNYAATLTLMVVLIANVMSQNMVADLTILILILYQTSKNDDIQTE